VNESISIGPVALSVAGLVAVGSLWLGWFAGTRAAKPKGLDVERPLYVVLAAGVLGARLGFVLQHLDAYAGAPLTMLDVRDGGWDAAIGFIAAAAAGLLLAVRRRSLALPLSVAVATAGVAWGAATWIPAALQDQGPELPALSLPTLDGSPVALSAFRGKPVVLNLWATWCPPCIREMPVLQKAQQERGDVHFVFVNQGEAAERVGRFLGTRGLALRNVLLDPSGEVARLMGARALPTTLFFDAQGRLVGARIGELSAATLNARLPPPPRGTDPAH
jgi:thiol-disulfide isomerase/thioredoxin